METKNIQTITQVITALDQIINIAITEKSPMGYFAALYRKVTIRVKKGIEEKEFEDNERMEKLDVIFACRYIEAYHQYRAQQAVTKSWLEAFKLSKKFFPIVLQHLLIGMNAHINLDLGIAAAEVMEGKDIKDLKNDFNKINEILASLVASVEQDLSAIWPTLKFLLKLTKKVDDFLINFAMEKARDGAWKFAVELSEISGKETIEKEINIRDQKVAKIGKLVTNPGFIVSAILLIVRLGERGTVAKRIKELMN